MWRQQTVHMHALSWVTGLYFLQPSFSCSSHTASPPWIRAAYINKEDKIVTLISKFWTRSNASHSLFCWFKASCSANPNSCIVCLELV